MEDGLYGLDTQFVLYHAMEAHKKEVGRVLIHLL